MLSLVICCCSLLLPQEEAEAITVTRFSDEVVIYSAQLAAEKRLYYWEKRYNITKGDELRQGAGAVSEMRFADGTLIRSFHTTIIRPSGFEGGVRTIVFRALFSAIVELGSDRTRIRLPGGVFFEGSNSHLTIEQRDEVAWVLKNSGPEVVKLDGLPRAAGVAELQPGYRIVVPNLPPLDRGPAGKIQEDVLSGLRVQAGDGIRLEHSAVGLVLSGTGPGDGIADIGGSRILVVAGYQLHLARVARPVTLASPTAEMPAPAASETPRSEPARRPAAEPPGPPLPDEPEPAGAGSQGGPTQPPDGHGAVPEVRQDAAPPEDQGPPIDDSAEPAGPPIPTGDGS